MSKPFGMRLIFATLACAILAGCATLAGLQNDTPADTTQKMAMLEKRMEAVEARQRDMTAVLPGQEGQLLTFGALHVCG
jgi:uncharacterized lipoprotein YajG